MSDNAPRERTDGCRRKGSVIIQRRQNPGEPSGEHRLAGARRTGHQQMVPTSRRYKDRGNRLVLADDVGKVQRLLGRVAVSRRVDGIGLGNSCVDPVA